MLHSVTSGWKSSTYWWVYGRHRTSPATERPAAIQKGFEKMSAAQDQVLELGRRWADAELRGDGAALDTLLADDFAAIGPRGFALDRQQWLDRYRSGDLKNAAFFLRDVNVREHGDTAILIGVQDQRSTFQGHDASGRFRLGMVAVRQVGRWVIAGLQLSGPMPDMPPARA